jgi:hypothetical protein
MLFGDGVLKNLGTYSFKQCLVAWTALALADGDSVDFSCCSRQPKSTDHFLYVLFSKEFTEKTRLKVN